MQELTIVSLNKNQAQKVSIKANSLQLNELDNILVYHTKDDKTVIRNENKEINPNFENQCKGKQLIRVRSDNLKQEIRFA